MHRAGPVASTGPDRVHAAAEVDRETVDAAATWIDAVARRARHGADGRVYLEDALPGRRAQQTAPSGMKHHRPRWLTQPVEDGDLGAALGIDDGELAIRRSRPAGGDHVQQAVIPHNGEAGGQAGERNRIRGADPATLE